MTRQASIYVAVAAADLSIADVVLAHLQHYNYHCVDCMDVPHLLDSATDLYGTMSECDVIVLVDSFAFRQKKPNYELQFAQELAKPLIVISLNQKIDESQSTWHVRLFDFTNPRHRDWKQVLNTIVILAKEATHNPDDDFLF